MTTHVIRPMGTTRHANCPLRPGMGFAGVIGAVLLVLGFVALSVLPFHIGGLLLLALTAALCVAEVLIRSAVNWLCTPPCCGRPP